MPPSETILTAQFSEGERKISKNCDFGTAMDVLDLFEKLVECVWQRKNHNWCL